MTKTTWSSAIVFLVLAGAVAIVSPPTWSRLASAQEDEEERREEERDEEEEEGEGDVEDLERRLDQIEAKIDRAEDQGDEDLVRKLRREGERLLDQLERIERAREEEEGGEEHEEWERHIHELEMHQRELEIARLHQEIEAMRQENSVRAANIAESRLTSASHAISQAIEYLGEDHAVDFLEGLLEDTEAPEIERLIRHRLADVHRERPDAALRQLRALISGE